MGEDDEPGRAGQVLGSELLEVFSREGERGGGDHVAHVRGQDVQFGFGQVACLVGDQHLGDGVPAVRIGALIAHAA
jgi:hypothetical protein